MTMTMLKNLLIGKKDVVKTRNINEEPFELANGGKSRLFVDVKYAMTDIGVLRITARTIYHMALSGRFNYDSIGCIATGGIALGAAVAMETNDNLVVIRSKKWDEGKNDVEHNRGTKKNLIGDVNGLTVLLVEDVTTTGRSVADAVDVINDNGGYCTQCIAVVDREEGAKELLEEYGVELWPLLKKSDLLEGKDINDNHT